MTRRSKLNVGPGVGVITGMGMLAALALSMGGCQSASEAQLTEARFNSAPGMATLQQTEDEAQNAAFMTFDHNWRAMRSDLGRLLLTDRPSRLGPEPIR
jgi:hypothetical protein